MTSHSAEPSSSKTQLAAKPEHRSTRGNSSTWLSSRAGRSLAWGALSLLVACSSETMVGVSLPNADSGVDAQTYSPDVPAEKRDAASPRDTGLDALTPSTVEGADLARCESAARPLAEVVLQPGPEGKDSFLTSLVGPDTTPSPANEYITARGWTWDSVPGVNRGLLQFDLSAVPAGDVVFAQITLQADIRGAQPPLYFGHHALDGAKNDGWLLRIVEPWEEATVTWKTQPQSVPVPAALSAAPATDAVYLPASSSSSQTYVIDVTAMISGMLKGQLPNHGFLFRLAAEQPYRMLSFYSSDHPKADSRPKLTVVYRRPGC